MDLVAGSQNEDERGQIRPSTQRQDGGGGGWGQRQGSEEDQVLLRCHEDETGQVGHICCVDTVSLAFR